MKKNKKILKYIIIAVLSIIIIASCVFVAVKLGTENKEKEHYENLAEYMTSNQQETDNQQKEPNNNIQDETKEPKKTDRMLKLEKLRKDNKEIVAWLEIPGTNVSYPILQTDNNEYYLDRNYKKQYSAGGSIFLDKDVDLELPSSNFLMYGHRMENGTMFEDLLKYSKKDFYDKHKKMKFTTMQEDAEYEILAVFYSRVYYTYETNVFRYYYFTNADTEEEYNEFVANAKKVSIYDTGVEAQYGDQLMTLSTCEYSQEDGRFAIVAKKIEY